MKFIRLLFLFFVIYFCGFPFFSNTYAQYAYPTPTPTLTPTPTPTHTPTPTPIPQHGICGNVFTDVNRNAALTGNAPDGPDFGYSLSGQTIYLSNGQQATTDSNGNYCFGSLNEGNYTVSYTPPAGYQPATPTSYNISLTADTTVYFGVLIPPTPTFVPDPPSHPCSGNNPTVFFSFTSSGSTWFEVYDNTGSLVQSRAANSSDSFSVTLPPSYSNQSFYYTVRAFYDHASGQYNQASTTQSTFFNCYYTVSGSVFEDLNHNGSYDPGIGETIFMSPPITISLTGQPNQNTVNGTYSFGTLLAGQYTLQRGILPAGYITSPSSFSSTTFNLTGDTTINFAIVQVYTISGTVRIDYDHNGSADAVYPSGVTVRLTGHETYTGNPIDITTTTDVNGNYTFSGVYAGSDYIVSLLTNTLIPNSRYYVATTSLSAAVEPSVSGKDFLILPQYNISGEIFEDQNKDGIKNGVEANMTTGSYQVLINGVPYNAVNGVYSATGLYEGTYTVVYNGTTPAEYQMTPIAGPHLSSTIQVGRTCILGGDPNASCTALFPGTFPFASFDVANVDFGMSNDIPWFQCIGGSCRIEGFPDPIPSTAGCGTGTYAAVASTNADAGIIYSGNASMDLGTGGGQASSRGWAVDTEAYAGTINRTSTTYLKATLRQSGISSTSLSSVCTENNCTLPADLANGVYESSGDVTLHAYTFPTNKQYVFIINGDLTIDGEIHVPTGSYFIVSVTGDIHIDQDVGIDPAESGGVCSQRCNVEGVYSSDNSFIIDAINNCAIGVDKRFNLCGSVAALSGGVQNNRDLCADDRTAPSFSTTVRPDFLLNAPDFIKYKSDVWQEVAP